MLVYNSEVCNYRINLYIVYTSNDILVIHTDNPKLTNMLRITTMISENYIKKLRFISGT